MLHLIAVDEIQHKEGPDAPAVRDALLAQDSNVALIRRAIADSGLGPRTLLIVTGDHGFTEIRANLNPLAALRDGGFLTVEDGKVASWRANVRSSGGSAAVYVKDPADVAAVRELLLGHAVHEGRRLFDLLDRPQLDALGYNPDAAFAIEPADGWAVAGALAPRMIEGSRPTVKGNHGQRPERPGLSTGFVAVGPSIPPGTVIDRMSLLDIAPTIARALGLDLPGVEGRELLTK
jgi:predicted AlkP superfamily pyrophosphatase or phosphodiesterase